MLVRIPGKLLTVKLGTLEFVNTLEALVEFILMKLQSPHLVDPQRIKQLTQTTKSTQLPYLPKNSAIHRQRSLGLLTELPKLSRSLGQKVRVQFIHREAVIGQSTIHLVIEVQTSVDLKPETLIISESATIRAVAVSTPTKPHLVFNGYNSLSFWSEAISGA